MRLRFVCPVMTVLLIAGFVAADEFDAVIDGSARTFTKLAQKKTPDAFGYGKQTLDSKGKVIKTTYNSTAVVTKDTIVAWQL